MTRDTVNLADYSTAVHAIIDAQIRNLNDELKYVANKHASGAMSKAEFDSCNRSLKQAATELLRISCECEHAE